MKSLKKQIIRIKSLKRINGRPTIGQILSTRKRREENGIIRSELAFGIAEDSKTNYPTKKIRRNKKPIHNNSITDTFEKEYEAFKEALKKMNETKENTTKVEVNEEIIEENNTEEDI